VGWTRRPRVLSFVAATVGALLVSAVPASAGPNANIVHNPSFEAPVTPSGTVYQPGQHLPGPWEVSVAPVGVGPPFPGATTGIKGRNLQSLSVKDPYNPSTSPFGVVCQALALDGTSNYNLRFYSADVNLPGTLIVQWRGSTVASFDDPPSLGTTVWTLHRVALDAAGATTGTLCFTGSGSGYPIVDLAVVHATG
jgi:hypothetical protein